MCDSSHTLSKECSDKGWKKRNKRGHESNYTEPRLANGSHMWVVRLKKPITL